MKKISKFRDEIDLKRNPKVMKSLTRVENNYREPGKDDLTESGFRKPGKNDLNESGFKKTGKKDYEEER